MKRLFKIALRIIQWLFCLSLILSIILGLIFDTIGTLKVLAPIAIPIVVWIIGATLYEKLQSKNRIDWKKYPDLDNICGGISFASGFLLVESIVCCFIFREDNIFEYNGVFFFLILSLYSFWVVVSLLLAKRNALYLLRLYFISIISLIFMRLYSEITTVTEIELNSFSSFTNIFTIDSVLFFLLLSFILAAYIKGLILSLKPNLVELFKDGTISFFQILANVLIWVCIVALYNTDITFKESPHSDYPALNVSK